MKYQSKMAVNNYNITSLRLTHWNANGLRKNLNEVKQFLIEENIDIMLLNETKLKSLTKFKVTGYQCVRKERDNDKAGGGVMIRVKDNIQYSEVFLSLSSIEAVAIKLSDNLIIVSVYNPPKSKLLVNDLNILNKLGKKILIYGDLNAKNTYWNCKNNNANGNIILDFTINKMFQIIAPDGPTLYPYNSNTLSTVDIGLARNLKCNINLEILNKFNSDHLPINIILTNSTKIKCHDRKYFNYKLAKWDMFRKIINENLVIDQKILTQTDIDNSISNLVKMIQNASNKSIPLAPGNAGKHYMLPPDIKALIKTRNNLRKMYQRTYSEEIRKIKNKLSNVITKKLVNFNNNNWNKKLNSLNIKDNSLWKMAKCFTKTTVTTIPALQGQDGLVYNDLEKSNLLAAHYEKVHNMTNCMRNDAIDRLADATNQSILDREITVENIDLVTPREIQKAVTRTKSKKAPGLDGI